MSNSFIQLALRGKNQRWRYLVGSLLALFVFVVVGNLVSWGLLAAYLQSDGNPETRLLPAPAPGESPILGLSPIALYLFFNLGFPFLWLGLYLALRFLHGRSLLTLITPAARISWRRIAQGFGVFFMLKVLEILVSYAIAPEDFTWSFDPRSFFIFLPLVLLVTPVQTSAEELLCRGYLLQCMGSHCGKWAGIVLSSILFMALHSLNPEVTGQDGREAVASVFLYYFMVGAFLAWLTVKDRTLELALGVHAAHNAATLLLVTSPESALPSPAIFSIREIAANFNQLFYAALWFLIFALVIFKLLKRPVVDLL
jgi:uncharacterized protein